MSRTPPGIPARRLPDGIEFRRAALEELIDLRHEILRAGLPREAAIFEGDRRPDSRHYGAFRGARAVGCATLHLNQWEGEPAWQLRGMAVATDLSGRGVGQSILRFLEEDVSNTSPVRLLWCNARVPAAGFYQKQGWAVRSERFEIPTAGPHFKMTKRLDGRGEGGDAGPARPAPAYPRPGAEPGGP